MVGKYISSTAEKEAEIREKIIQRSKNEPKIISKEKW